MSAQPQPVVVTPWMVQEALAYVPFALGGRDKFEWLAQRLTGYINNYAILNGPQANTRPLYIFDMDGTLALIEHRVPLLADKTDRQRWDRFYAACGDDLPNPPVIRTLELLRAQGADVWVFSGRRDSARELTTDWLTRYTSLARDDLEHTLVMRQTGDSRPDEAIKQEFVERMLDVDRARLVAVFDDRSRVVAMWRRLGITCYQVAPGAF